MSGEPSLNMTWRWFGEGNDSISLDQIRQIPGVRGIAWSLHDMAPGEIWDFERIKAVKDQCNSKGFHIDVVESVNVHDDIKTGSGDRDRYIDNYIDTIEKLSRVGVKVICYNFMPVFDWVRTDMYHRLPDGSNALFYEKQILSDDPQELIDKFMNCAGEFTLPGWEPERLAQIKSLFAAYAAIDEAALTENLKYFLVKIMPACEKYDVRMAIHPDDPPWPIFNLPRIVRSQEHIRRLLALVDSPYNGLTLCTGSLGSSPANNIPQMIHEFGSRIHFAHIRNVKRFENGDFIETSHRARDGSVDTVGTVKALYDIGYQGYIRPDHGRHIWGEEKHCRPGYGLYDRALGVMYLQGIWDTLEQEYLQRQALPQRVPI